MKYRAEQRQLHPDDGERFHGRELRQVRGFDVQVLQSVDRGVADDVPEFAGEPERQDERYPEPIERTDDAVAQFLQVLHEGHAQHARPLPRPLGRWPVERGGGGGGGRRIRLVSVHHFDGRCRNNFGVGGRRSGLGRSFPFGRGNSLLIVFHSSSFSLRVALGVDGFRRGWFAHSMPGWMVRATDGPRYGSITGASEGDTLDSAP